jgi:hypothetical protein
MPVVSAEQLAKLQQNADDIRNVSSTANEKVQNQEIHPNMTIRFAFLLM